MLRQITAFDADAKAGLHSIKATRQFKMALLLTLE
jgi:hypothetical protein